MASVTMPLKRPYGRSLGDFCNKDGESGLLSAEKKLLAAAAKGEECCLDDNEERSKLHNQLDTAVSAPDMITLLTEVVASWGASSNPILEARVKAQPRIIEEFITELPGFVDGHAKAPHEIRTRVLNEPEILTPFINELRERFNDELRRWRQVNPADVAVRVRASFLRFLALGGDESTPIHEKGVRLRGALVTGDLDFEAAVVHYPLILHDCRMEEGKL